MQNGIRTYESCEGGPGHAYPEPTVCFHAQFGKALTALGMCIDWGLPVKELRHVWRVDFPPDGDHKLGAPTWMLVFWEKVGVEALP